MSKISIDTSNFSNSILVGVPTSVTLKSNKLNSDSYKKSEEIDYNKNFTYQDSLNESMDYLLDLGELTFTKAMVSFIMHSGNIIDINNIDEYLNYQNPILNSSEAGLCELYINSFVVSSVSTFIKTEGNIEDKTINAAGTLCNEYIKFNLNESAKDIFSYYKSPIKISEWRLKAPQVDSPSLLCDGLASNLISKIGGSIITDLGIDAIQCAFSIITLNDEINPIEWGKDIYRGSMKGIFSTIGSIIFPGPIGSIVMGAIGTCVADITSSLYRTQEGLALGGALTLGGAIAGASFAIVIGLNPIGWGIAVFMIAGTAVGIATSLIFDYVFSLRQNADPTIDYPISASKIMYGSSGSSLTICSPFELVERINMSFADSEHLQIHLKNTDDDSGSRIVGCLTPVGKMYPKIYIYNIGQAEAFKDLFLENPGTTGEYYSINWECS